MEIDYTGKVKDTGKIFDSNIKKNIDKIGLKVPAKPFIFSLGQGMFLEGVDKFLIGKETGKEYTLDLPAEKAFGVRDTKIIQVVPLQLFKQNNINPSIGSTLNFDGKTGKILSVSGGRVRVDFNHPLAGKDIVYDLKVLRKVDKKQEQVEAFNEFIFKKKLKFEIKDKKLILEVEKQLVPLANLFKDKYKELFDLDLEVKEVEVVDKKE